MSYSAKALRLAVATGLVAAAAVHAPWPLSAPIAGLAIASVVDLLGKLSARPTTAERVLLGTTGAVSTAIVAGLILNVVGGLTRTGWSLAWLVVTAAALLIVDSGGSRHRRRVLPHVEIWVAVVITGVGFAAAMLVGWAGVHRENATPLLALAAEHYGGDRAHVLVRASNFGGSYTLEVLPGGASARGYRAQSLELPTRGTTSVQTTVYLSPGVESWTVALAPRGESRPIRSITIWKGTAG